MHLLDRVLLAVVGTLPPGRVKWPWYSQSTVRTQPHCPHSGLLCTVSIPSPSASPSVGWGVLSRVSGCLTCQLVSCDALGSSARLARPRLPDKWQKRGAWGMNEEAPLPHPASAPSPTSAPLDGAPGRGHLPPPQGHSVPTHSTASAFFGDFYLRLSFSFEIFRLTENLEAADFPADPVVKTPHFHCRGCRFDPWSGKFRMQHGAAKKKKKSKLSGRYW